MYILQTNKQTNNRIIDPPKLKFDLEILVLLISMKWYSCFHEGELSTVNITTALQLLPYAYIFQVKTEEVFQDKPCVLEGCVTTLSTDRESRLFVRHRAGYLALFLWVSERAVNVQHQSFFLLPSQHDVLPMVDGQLGGNLPGFRGSHDLVIKRSV